MSFVPYVPNETNMAEFTWKAVIAGIIFGVLFGCANAYLGLRVGLTISTSIPIAVITVFFYKMFKKISVGTILEYNTTQTVGSASSSLASGVIFTIPALFMWGVTPSILQIATLAALGGVLGILAMIPLRPYLMVEEHGHLPYPEGTACAEVLKATQSDSSLGKYVFLGLGLGAIVKFMIGYLKLWTSNIAFYLPIIPKAELSLKATPALLGVGYILGFRIALISTMGGLVSWLVLIPILAAFGDTSLAPYLPAWGLTITDMPAHEIWHRYIRYVGAGAVTFGGVAALAKAIPAMISSLKAGLGALSARAHEMAQKADRTSSDLPFKTLLIGVSLVILVITFTPHVIGTETSLLIRFLAALCIALFAFIFVTVSSRIVGLIGVSSNPTSGMTIMTLFGLEPCALHDWYVRRRGPSCRLNNWYSCLCRGFHCW